MDVSPPTTATTTTVDAAPNPSTFGQPVAFQATVSPSSGQSTPTGTVTFTIDGTAQPAVPLTGCAATLPSISTLTVAGSPHIVAATYNPDTANFTTSTGTLTGGQTVNRATPKVSVKDAGGTSNGSAFPATATVAGVVAGVDDTPASSLEGVTPTLSYYDAHGSLLPGAPTNTGNYTVVASFPGSADYAAASSPPAPFTIVPASTTTAVASSANPSVYGLSVTFMATVSAVPPGGGTPTGSVQFVIDGSNYGAPVTLSGGTASISDTALTAAGSPHTIAAMYANTDGNYSGSSGSVPQTVNPAATTTVLTSVTDPSVFGQPVTFIATVSPTTGQSTPTGTVTFMDGLTEIGTGTLAALGIATFTTSALAAGDHLITADYAGDGNYKGSSGSVPQTVNQPLEDNGPPGAAPGIIVCGEPITINTGNVYQSIVDYSTAGSNLLDFTRYYNSNADVNTSAVTLGKQWRSTYDRYLHMNSASSVTAERATGQVLNFTLVGGVWTSGSDMDYKLTQTGSTWALTGPDDTVETYTGNGSGLGLLGTIQARDGYTQTLQYNASHQLAKVTDSFGRALSFTYQNGLLSTLTTPDGLVLTFRYGSSGSSPGVLDELASVTYPTAPQTSQTYDYYPHFLLKDVIDQDGNRFVSYAYDSQNRATQSYMGGNPGTGSVTVSYNDTDGSRTVTDANGLHTVYRFAMLQGVPKVTEIDRQPSTGPPTASTFTYDANGYVASTTDWNGNVTRYVNDAHGQPTSITEAAGTPLARTTIIAYLPTFHLPVHIVAPGLTTNFTYDAHGNLLTRTETDTSTQSVPYSTNGQAHTWTYTYDTLGHALTADGPRTDVNDKITFTYDVTGNLSTVTDALGHVTRITSYNLRGLPMSLSDANGVVTTLAYDPMGRLTTRTVQTTAGNAVTRFGYDPAGLLTSLTLPDNSVLYYAYDAAQRLTGISDPAGERIVYSLDGMGNIIRQDIRNSSGAIVKTQSQVFNALNQLVQSVGAIPTEVTSYAHDANGNVTSITDASNHTTLQAFDALNRLIKVTDPLNGVMQYGYDVQGNNASVTSPRNLTTSYIYDGFGQVIQVTSPDTGTTIYHLDPAGNRVSETDARGVVTNRTFDALNRVTSETFPASTGENIAYTYDSTAGGNKGVGRLTRFTDETGSTTLKYDALGDVIAMTQTIAGKAYTTAYAYNLAGQVTQVTYPSGRIVSYSRDSQGRISGVTTRANSTAAAVTLASGVTYEPFGPLASLTYGNGLVMTRSFDADYRITGITTQSGTAKVQNLSLGYDANSNVTSIIDSLTPARSQTFTYDALYRLTTASGAYATVSYTYDADSNRLTSTQGGVTQTYNYSSTSDRLLSVTGSNGTRGFAYTANGNMATDSRDGRPVVYGYGSRDRLRSVSLGGGLTVTYQFDALGERLVKGVQGIPTLSIHYHYDEAGHLISETIGATGAAFHEYVWLGDLPLAQIEGNGTIEYIHADQQNTPQKMTNTSKAVVWDSVQQPFGETTSTTGTVFGSLRFPGQVADIESGLSYNMMRDYDPTLGRYVEADPIGLAGGVSLYGYVGQNPVGRSDPLGLCTNNYPYPEPDLPLDAPLIDPIDILSGGLAGGLRALLAGGLRGLFATEADTSIAILKSGYYEVNGLKFSKYYYEKLWSTGRPAPSLVAKEILGGTAGRGVPDIYRSGFFRYEYGGWEMIYNPATKEVWHLQPIR